VNKVVFILRRSTEYFFEDKLVMPDCAADREFWEEYTSTILQSIDWWDSLFDIPYLEFRKKLRRIPAQLVADSQYDLVLNHLDWQTINKLRELPETWIVPHDEDDWPNPQLPTILRKVNMDLNECVCWKVHRVDSDKVSTCDLDFFQQNIILSNAYAIQGSAPEIILTLHVYAHEYFTRRPTKYLRHPLSMKVNNPASMTLLRSVQSREALAKQVSRFKTSDVEVPSVYREAYTAYRRLIAELL
jgi:hypothetical protein